jgi:hypothetical protein
VPGRSFWNTLEAIGLNTEFLGMCYGACGRNEVRAGPTIAARRATLEGIGGLMR